MSSKKSFFELIKTNQQARLGRIKTTHGIIDTPTFMPVGTQGTIKSIFVDDILKTGTQIILGNTYHLFLRPGIETLNKFGGLQKFMNWNKPILTDSGGFQVMSLSKFNKIDEKKGAIFSSHIDGKKFILSPEKSIQIQKAINSDILMVLDVCPKLSKNKKNISEAIKISNNWAKRSKEEFNDEKNKFLFGIIQGGLFEDLRLESLENLKEQNFDGLAMGGLAVGENQNEMFNILNKIVKLIPDNKPRYLMGVGTPSDILGAVSYGIDMFDCVLPTRSGRTGLAYTWEGKINLRNSKFKKDHSPLNPDNDLRDLNMYSKSYLNHLINTNEILASMLISLHNVNFYQEFMKKIRDEIKEGTFSAFYKKYIGMYN